jgi:hypothetical protein
LESDRKTNVELEGKVRALQAEIGCLWERNEQLEELADLKSDAVSLLGLISTWILIAFGACR